MNFKGQAGKLISKSIELYENVIGRVHHDATSQEARAYGGVVRANKGKMVETITKNIIRAAWLASEKDESRLQFKNKKYNIPIVRKYVNEISDCEIRRQILANIEEYKIAHGTDIHVYIDERFKLSVECKAYTENAMLKRILFDAYLLQTQFPELKFLLVQLESMLGGDYANLPERVIGSKSSRTLMSYMQSVNLEIITLLPGARHVDRPIHKSDFYKPLEKDTLIKAAKNIAKLLTV